MLTQAQLAAMVAASYSQKADVATRDGAMAMLRPVGDEFVVVLPGTHLNDGAQTVLDALADLSAWPAWRGPLGFCHSGFSSGGEALWREIAPIIPRAKRLVLAGHSLGAAHALYLGAKNAAAGLAPCRISAFEPPRVGMAMFGWHVRKALQVYACRFGDDPVPLLPPMFPIPFHHPVRLAAIGCAMLDPIDCHAIGGVVTALTEMGI